METKTFPARDLLTVTTGRLLTKPKGPKNNGIGDLYALLGWMTDSAPFTHQLPRVAGECGPWLLKWFPELAAADAGSLDSALHADPQGGCEAWLEWLVASGRVKAAYDVPRLPAGAHKFIDPIAELEGMVGKDRVIVVEAE